jgi:hypothetical protein
VRDIVFLGDLADLAAGRPVNVPDDLDVLLVARKGVELDVAIEIDVNTSVNEVASELSPSPGAPVTLRTATRMRPPPGASLGAGSVIRAAKPAALAAASWVICASLPASQSCVGAARWSLRSLTRLPFGSRSCQFTVTIDWPGWSGCSSIRPAS